MFTVPLVLHNGVLHIVAIELERLVLEHDDAGRLEHREVAVIEAQAEHILEGP